MAGNGPLWLRDRPCVRAGDEAAHHAAYRFRGSAAGPGRPRLNDASPRGANRTRASAPSERVVAPQDGGDAAGLGVGDDGHGPVGRGVQDIGAGGAGERDAGERAGPGGLERDQEDEEPLAGLGLDVGREAEREEAFAARSDALDRVGPRRVGQRRRGIEKDGGLEGGLLGSRPPADQQDAFGAGTQREANAAACVSVCRR